MFKHSHLYQPVDITAENSEQGRQYTTPEGKKYESITTALGKRPGKQDSLNEWRKRVGIEKAERISKLATNTGTAVHSLIEDYLNNVPNCTAKWLPTVVEIFTNMRPYLIKHVEQVYMQECGLYSDEYRLAGRVDCVAEWEGHLAIVDFKTSRKPKKEEWIEDYFLQCAAYAFMFEEMYDVLPSRIVVLIGRADGVQVFTDDPENWRLHEFFTSRKSF